MAKLIKGKTANDLWNTAKELIETDGAFTPSRRGGTKEVLHVLFELENPVEKWVYKRTPPISIGFALAELMWILNGSQDAGIINFWNPTLGRYAADDNKDTYHGAYGYRLREGQGFDQIERAYQSLKNNPNNRQTVMLIWDPKTDFPNRDGTPQSNDIPCNICSLLKIRDGHLNWTQIMRSNDLVLGLPYNLVQFTGLQEIMAGWLDLKVGSYSHFSDSLHIYDEYDFIKEIGFLPELKTVTNTDVLALDKNDFDMVSKDIFERMRKMAVLTNPTENEYRQLATLNSKFEAYNNIMFMIGAYAANRHNLKSLVRELIKNCSNPIYTSIWNQWIEHLNTRA